MRKLGLGEVHHLFSGHADSPRWCRILIHVYLSNVLCVMHHCPETGLWIELGA